MAFGFTACKTTKDLSPEIAALFASAVLGFAGLPVTFTVEVEGIVEQWEWDFDNDGMVDSTESEPTYTFTTPGIYSVRLKATNPDGSDEFVSENLIRILMYFYGEDDNGEELWVSDGTASGTRMVKDIAAGGTGSYIGDLIAVNSTLFFRADDVTNGSEL